MTLRDLRTIEAGVEIVLAFGDSVQHRTAMTQTEKQCGTDVECKCSIVAKSGAIFARQHMPFEVAISRICEVICRVIQERRILTSIMYFCHAALMLGLFQAPHHGHGGELHVQ